MDEPLHAEARVRPAVRGVDAQVRARPVVLALLLHPRQGVAADQPAHAHAADDERLRRALACLADALHQHLRVELDLRQAVVEPDDDHVVARRVQRVDHPRCVEQLVHVVAGVAPGEPLHEDHGIDDLPAARGAEDPGHPLLAGLAVGPLRLQRPGVVSARGRRVVGDGQRHPRLERLGAVGAAHGDLRAVARRVGGREHIAERGLDETPPVAEVDRDGVGQRCSGIGEVEALVELEPHVAAAMHRGIATPLAVHVRRRHERLALLDRIGQPRGQRAGLPAVGGPARMLCASDARGTATRKLAIAIGSGSSGRMSRVAASISGSGLTGPSPSAAFSSRKYRPPHCCWVRAGAGAAPVGKLVFPHHASRRPGTTCSVA